MHRLDSRDTYRLLAAIERLNSDLDPKTLPGRALALSEAIVPGDCASFDFFSSDNSYNSTVWTNRPDITTPENMSVFAQYVHEHKLIPIALAKQDGVAMKMTDVVGQADFERTGLFNEFYRQHGVNRQMGLALPVASDLTVSCAVTSGGKDFTERDRAMMTLAAPHLLNAMRNAIAYGRINSALVSGGCGVVALDSNDAVTFANDNIRGLLTEYFPDDVLKPNGLPATVMSWIAEMSRNGKNADLKPPARPLVVENRAGTLRIRLMENEASRERTLLLEEKRFSPSKIIVKGSVLTRREAEILFWITNGKTNEVIATICEISMRTVHKHVEHIYQKLGVETRTAAMLRGLELI